MYRVQRQVAYLDAIGIYQRREEHIRQVIQFLQYNNTIHLHNWKLVRQTPQVPEGILYFNDGVSIVPCAPLKDSLRFGREVHYTDKTHPHFSADKQERNI